jgi:hypothetical protein
VAVALAALATFAALAVGTPAMAKADSRPDLAVSQVPWDCPVGSFCVWNQNGGVGKRCVWSDADPDWYLGSIRCSWEDAGEAVFSMLNRGTSSRFSGVCVYPRWNYEGVGWWLAQNGVGIADQLGLFFRSHKWVAGGPGVCPRV